MLAVSYDANGWAELLFEPVREGVLSWNTFAERGLLEFRLLRAHVSATEWLPHSEWTARGRKSFSPKHEDVTVDIDVIRSTQPFDGIEVRAGGVEFNALYFSAPQRAEPSLPYAASAHVLEVPPRSQYAVESERGWCSPAAISMLNAYHGLDVDVAETARAVFDRSYNSTGNWSFNVAFSGSLGLRAAVVYLRNLEHAQRLIEAGIPIAISYSWQADELPGAPLAHSDGHLAVLCGFTYSGDCAMNDPAAPNVRVVYPRGAIEKIWQRNNGVAYTVAPAGIDFVSILNT